MAVINDGSIWTDFDLIEQRERLAGIQDLQKYLETGEDEVDEDGELCMTCFNSYPADKFFGLGCAHRFCMNCIRKYLKVELLDKQTDLN